MGIEPRKGSSSGTSTPGQSEPTPVAGKKHRFEDTEYLEQSKELVDGVKNAVSAGKQLSSFMICCYLTVMTSATEEEKEGQVDTR